MSNKTQPTDNSVFEFINAYPNTKITKDCLELLEFFAQQTGENPVMWGKVIGFGKYHYKYASGRQGHWFTVGFAPSKTGITIYTTCMEVDISEISPKLGKYKIGKSCIYIKQLSDIDLGVLKQIVILSINKVK